MKTKIILNLNEATTAEVERFDSNNPNGNRKDCVRLNDDVNRLIPLIGKAISVARIPHSFRPSWELNGKGDIKTLMRGVQYLIGIVADEPLRATARMVRPLCVWANQTGYVPVGNGSFKKIASDPDFWRILIKCQKSDNWYSGYWQGKQPNESQIGTITRQLSLAKDILFVFGIIAKDGKINRNGLFNATLKGGK